MPGLGVFSLCFTIIYFPHFTDEEIGFYSHIARPGDLILRSNSKYIFTEHLLLPSPVLEAGNRTASKTDTVLALRKTYSFVERDAP